jgi:hypothetical protein
MEKFEIIYSYYLKLITKMNLIGRTVYGFVQLICGIYIRFESLHFFQN